MKLTLTVSLFSGALGTIKLPLFSPEQPVQVGLIMERHDEAVGIECQELLEKTDTNCRISACTLNPGVTGISRGDGFIMKRGNKMLGKGTVYTVNA